MATKQTAATAAPAAQTAKPAQKPNTLEMARILCPDAEVAARTAEIYGLELPDFAALLAEHYNLVKHSTESLKPFNDDKSLEMSCQRLVSVFVAGAVGAGKFASAQMDSATRKATSLLNDDRDADRDGIVGYETDIEKALGFAAQKALSAYAQLACAEGAVKAFKAVIGSDWKAYVAPLEAPATVQRRSIAEQLAAFQKKS